MSCEKFKSILKQKIDETAKSYLKNKRKEKTKNIDINHFKPKEYLMSKNLSVTEVQNLFKLRNCMIDVKGNFHSGNKDDMFDLLDHRMVFQSLKRKEFYAKNYTIILNARKDILSLVNGDQ